MIDQSQLPPLLPVLDILNGDVVWGIAGQRQRYRPLQSPLAHSSRPLDVACGLRAVVGHSWLYVADLDAIQQNTPQWSLLEELADKGFQLVVDAGLRDVSRAQALCNAGVKIVIAALETVPHETVLRDIVAAIGGHRTYFSLDLLQGQLLGDRDSWRTENPISIGTTVLEMGVGGLIILDLAGVGVGEGVPTRQLCQEFRQAHPAAILVTGGGVRQWDDVQNLLMNGVNSVLVASALHQGTIVAAEIQSLR